MAKKENRFIIKTVKNDMLAMSTVILVDVLTGVQYLYTSQGYGGGITPLLGADGKPMLDNSYKYGEL